MLDPERIQTYADRLRGKPAARQQYLAVIAAWAQHVKNEPDRKSIDDRIKEMTTDGYAAGTVELHFRAIRSFFAANGLPWPYRRGDGPKIKERDVIKLALGDDLIKRLVDVARSGLVSPLDSAHLALSTVYGMRRAEIGGITLRDIDLTARTVYVETIHNGREREHVLPDPLVPVLTAALPLMESPRSDKTMTRSFLRIEKAAGLLHTQDLGWHAIRRTLDTRLLEVAALSESAVQNFLRWKGDSGLMSRRYARGNTFVSADGEALVQSLGDHQIDLQVFAVHPFLDFWRDA